MTLPGNRPPQVDLSRFISAQAPVYSTALQELTSGRKRSHWMWYIFPQVDGLGFSETTRFYAIKSLEEARQYLNHPHLGSRLRECTLAVLSHAGTPASAIFGYPDDMKFFSCMTLFDHVAGPGSVFEKALDGFFQGQRDSRTLEILAEIQN